MPYLAPSLCPVCDREFQDRYLDELTGQEIWLHYRLREKCVREIINGEERTRTEKMIVPRIQ